MVTVMKKHKDKRNPNKTSIKFYTWHSDGTKTLVLEIPNKIYRSKYSDSRMEGYR